jgi:hypothetical protein
MKNLRISVFLSLCASFLFTGNAALDVKSKEFWTYPHDAYLFAPGILCAEYLVGKYCPYYETSTGQVVTGNQSFQTVNGLTARSCNFAEIVLTDEKKITPGQQRSLTKAFFEKNFYKFANFLLFKRTMEPYDIVIQGDSKTGYTLKPYLIDFSKINFGQELDIKILSDNYDQCCNNDMDSTMVLYGNSRGAATAFNFMALEYGKKTDKRIKAVVLEGCFDAVRHVTWLNLILKMLPSYRPKGIAPIEMAVLQKFVENCTANSIAVCCITSDTDKIVPSVNTKKLCQNLQKLGLKDFYLLELHHSSHSCYMLDNEEDARRYQSVVHAFYKKYGLSHNARLAQEGYEELERCAIS